MGVWMSMEIRRDVMIVVMFVMFDARCAIISEKICAVTGVSVNGEDALSKRANWYPRSTRVRAFTDVSYC
jgi:hypothetical protein